jgi:Obg family GTPase CgtA
VTVHVRAGKGGDGSCSFRREACVPEGGPDGGDGGRGGHVIFKGARNVDSLIALYFAPQVWAEEGVGGRGQKMHGRNGKDLYVPVPCGTEVFDAETGVRMADIIDDGQEVIIAQGGKGGLGNVHFRTSTHQVPTEHTPGEPGGEFRLRLELKTIADAGLLGFPNAGKSTLLNRLLAEERMVTGPEPGLTREAVAVRITDADGTPIELVDTAGLRRRARVEEKLEKASVGASLEAMRRAEVVVLVVDAVEGLHDQDLQIARLIAREGRACVMALNKWDAVADRDAARRGITDRLTSSLAQLKGIGVVTLSALTGQGIERLLPAVRAAHAVWNTRVPTAELNRWFEAALQRHQPPLVEGRRLKLRYLTQAKARPPTFVVFGTRAELLPEDFQRYLVNGLREAFNLPGTPIRLQLRGTKNPFAEE